MPPNYHPPNSPKAPMIHHHIIPSVPNAFSSRASPFLMKHADGVEFSLIFRTLGLQVPQVSISESVFQQNQAR